MSILTTSSQTCNGPPRSLNGLVKMQTATRRSGHEPVTVKLLRWLRSRLVLGSKPDLAKPVTTSQGEYQKRHVRSR
jgi:hypothetical protein